MKKVVVELPRGGSRQRNNKFGARLRYIPEHDYDDEPKKARGFESYSGGCKKWFTDLLGPLERFLRSNVGRPWDKMYSELCAGLDKRKVTGKHVFDHVDRMVEKHCFVGDDGGVYTRGWHGEWPVTGMYVHPRTGLLCEAPRKSKRERRRELVHTEEEVTRIYAKNVDSSCNLGYQKHGGIWYQVKRMRIVVGYKDPIRKVYDIFLKRDVQLNWGVNWVATEKKQCNREELKEVSRLLEDRQGRERRR
jgi:hypothetical protein